MTVKELYIEAKKADFRAAQALADVQRKQKEIEEAEMLADNIGHTLELIRSTAVEAIDTAKIAWERATEAHMTSIRGIQEYKEGTDVQNETEV